MEGNVELKEAEEWFEGLENGGVNEAVEEKEEVRIMMKRMKEELKGQADATLVGGARRKPKSSLGGEGEKERPGRRRQSVEEGKRGPPGSIPVLLHLLAGKVAKGMQDAIMSVGKRAKVDDEAELGGQAEGGLNLIRERFVSEVRIEL